MDEFEKVSNGEDEYAEVPHNAFEKNPRYTEGSLRNEAESEYARQRRNAFLKKVGSKTLSAIKTAGKYAGTKTVQGGKIVSKQVVEFARSSPRDIKAGTEKFLQRGTQPVYQKKGKGFVQVGRQPTQKREYHPFGKPRQQSQEERQTIGGVGLARMLSPNYGKPAQPNILFQNSGNGLSRMLVDGMKKKR